MSMRRFARLTNAFSKKIENHAAAVPLYFMYYNLGRVHQTLRDTGDGSWRQRSCVERRGDCSTHWLTDSGEVHEDKMLVTRNGSRGIRRICSWWIDSKCKGPTRGRRPYLVSPSRCQPRVYQ